jgi:hypothetical protein
MFPLITHEEDVMSHAIIRGADGRRHEVDFGNGPLRVEIHPREETVEIYVEADFETLPPRASTRGPPQHSSPPVQRSHRRSGATWHEPSSCILYR